MSTPSTVGAGSSNSTVSGASSTHSHALDVTGNVSILTGFLSNGGTIPLPAGYTESQCKWAAFPRTVNNTGDAGINSIECTVAGRVVTITSEGVSVAGNTASYIIIGVK